MNHLLVQGDARRLPLADGSVHCVVTSPPYWGLRDYGTATWEGGEPACDHKRDSFAPQKHVGSDGKLGTNCTNWDHRNEAHYRDVCGKCGARRIDAQLGLEASPEAFVAKLVAVFREVKRVLREDGTCWVNLGDSYASQPSGTRWNGGDGVYARRADRMIQGDDPRRNIVSGLKPKDLVGIPWRIAFALQADGWYLRSDIVWHKPNPMPESVTDRPTKAHEYIFMMAKNERYFWDQEGVREVLSESSRDQISRYENNGWSGEAPERAKGVYETHEPDRIRGITGSGRAARGSAMNPAGRNIRSVWTIPSESFPGAHFATFPRKLVMPCIKAGTSERGVCPICSAPWERVTETTGRSFGNGWTDHKADATKGMSQVFRAGKRNDSYRRSTLGWRPTCSHDAEPVPATVFDPFAGSGTTGVVALALQRNFIGTDLSATYLRMAERRISRPHARVERASKPEPMPLFAGLEV